MKINLTFWNLIVIIVILTELAKLWSVAQISYFWKSRATS
jgi:hypothetical protein